MEMANDDLGVDNSCRTRLARKREKTSQIFQAVASKIPNMSGELLVEIHDRAVSMLALVDQSEIGATTRDRRQEMKSRLVTESKTKSEEKINMTSIEDFPEEVLLEIMTYLNLGDRKNCRLVSKKWHRLSYDKKLIKDDWMFIETGDEEYFHPASRHLNVGVYGEDIDLADTLPYWETYGQGVGTIVLGGIPADLSRVLRYCPNVESITLCLTDSENYRSENHYPTVLLPRLKRLEYRSGCTRHRIPIEAPKLKEVVCDALLMSNAAFLQLMKNQSKIIEELDLRQMYEGEDYFQLIIDTFGPQLKRLYLNEEGSMSDSGLFAIVRKFNNIEHLSLTEWFGSTFALEYAISSLKNLTHLSLYGVDLSGASLSLFETINNWTQLIAIDLSKTKISKENLIVAFSSSHPKLLNLQLEGNERDDIDVDILNQICPNLPNLCALGLHNYVLRDEHIRVIAQHNGQLVDLSLLGSDVRHCSSINGIATLVHLSLAWCKPCVGLVQALSLPNLHTIDLSNTDTTTEDIEQLIERNPLLHKVVMWIWSSKGLYRVDDNNITDDIRGILERRRPGRFCRRKDSIFSWASSC